MQFSLRSLLKLVTLASVLFAFLYYAGLTVIYDLMDTMMYEPGLHWVHVVAVAAGAGYGYAFFKNSNNWVVAMLLGWLVTGIVLAMLHGEVIVVRE